MAILVNGVVNGHWTVVGSGFAEPGSALEEAALFLALAVIVCVAGISHAARVLWVAWRHRRAGALAVRQRHDRHVEVATPRGRTGANHPSDSDGASH